MKTPTEEEELAILDEIELLQMLEEAEADKAGGQMISHEEVKRRLGYPTEQNKE